MAKRDNNRALPIAVMFALFFIIAFVTGLQNPGIDAVIAKSFARIFYRNSINTGLAILECPEAVDAIEEGHVVSVETETGTITDETTGQVFTAQPFPLFIADIIEQGGLINRTRSVLGKE